MNSAGNVMGGHAYEVYQKPDGSWWFRCRMCGHGAGYKTKERATLLADTHVGLPHERS